MKPIGRGKYLPVEEGQLQAVPPSKTVFNRARPISKNFDSNWRNLREERPGWCEWRSRDLAEQHKVEPIESLTGRTGIAHGHTKQTMAAAHALVERILMEDSEMQELLASVQAENPAAAWALKEVIKLAAMPGSAKDRKDLLKIVLDFTKEKPVSKREIKTEDLSQDEYAKRLAGYDAEGDDWQPTKN